jgi:hypothetical protein
MLSGFESFLAELVGERLSARPGLAVSLVGLAPAPAAGAGVLQIGVTAAEPDAVGAFVPGDVLPPVDKPESIRALPLTATVTATLTRRGTAANDAALRAARSTALADATVLAHALDTAAVRGGRDLTSATADPGFRVREFTLSGLTVPTPTGDMASVVVTYACSLFVWPPGTTAEGEQIRAVDALIEVEPLTIQAQPAIVPAGGSAAISIAGVSGSRLLDPDSGGRAPLQLAIGIHSELSPTDRGTIAGGDASALTGFRTFTIAQPATTVTYTAPTGSLGAVRSEEIVVHLAKPSNGPAPEVGVRLASVVVALHEAP